MILLVQKSRDIAIVLILILTNSRNRKRTQFPNYAIRYNRRKDMTCKVQLTTLIQGAARKPERC